MAILDKTGLAYLVSIIETLLGGKVDKVNGKGLSTNDFTTAEQTKLASIEEGATKTKIYVQAELPPEDAPIGAIWIDTATTAIIQDEGVEF